MSNEIASRLRLTSLRGRLLLLVLLALIPPLALNLFGAWHERARELDAAREDLQRMANLAAANEERFIAGARQFLGVLAEVPDLRQDKQRCSAFLRSLLNKNDDYLNIQLAQLDGELFCAARSTPRGANVGDREYFKRTVADKEFGVSDYIYGRMFSQHTFNLTYPMLNAAGELNGVLFASVNLNAFDRFGGDIGLPPEAVMTTADRHGTILTHRPAADQRLIGKPAPAVLRHAVRNQQTALVEAADDDGVVWLHAFAPVRLNDNSSFMLSVALPRHSVMAPANRQQAFEFLMLLLAAGVAIFATWILGEVTIVRRIQALVRTVRRIADGDLATRSGVRGGAELDRLGQAIDRMAESLQEHERARSAAQARLFEEKERAQVTLASIGDAVITTDQLGRIEYMNPVAEALTGWPHAAGRGQPLAAVFHTVSQHSREPVQNPVEQALSAGSIVTLNKDALLIARDGSEYAVEDSAAPIRDRSNAIIGAVLVFRDVSQSRSLAVQLSHQASHDPLTGLVNRREFERRLGLALDAASSQERHYSVLYMDLDQFKIVNDTCGHGAGDDLLRQVTTLLQPLLRESDTLARLGGDEFGALLENCTPDAAIQIADKLRQTICDFHFVWRDRMFYIGVSIGIVNFHNGMLSMAEVLSAADSACYLAKEHGRNRLHVYHPEDDELMQRHGQMEWMGRIQRAFREDRFRLYSQRIVATNGDEGSSQHHELLLRMVGENGEIVPPMAFIPAAERYDLMPEIDRWVIRTAFARCAELLHANAGRTRHTFSVNLSGASLNDPKFLDFVCEQFRDFGVPYRNICFEITETTAIANLTKAIHFMRELRELGCRFSLDDFGSGMSSFAYLKHLPVDFLKIDGGFVADIVNNAIDRAMVEAINHIGHVMGIRTVAEWVEDEATLAELKAIGVDYVQGYAVAPLQPF